MRLIIIGGLVGALAITGAGCKEKPQVLESEPAVAPNAPRWRQATAAMIFEHGSGSYPTRIRYGLKLSGPAGEHKATLEQVFPPSGVAGDPLAVPTADFEALKKKKPRVQFAADGHALLFSRDGGPRHRYVALDAGEKPVYCPHLTIEAGPSGDPWPAAPTSRALALAILRTRADKGELHYPSSDGAWSSAFEHEALGAIAFACAHPFDAELRAAIASAAKPWKAFATSVVTDTLSKCASALPGAP